MKTPKVVPSIRRYRARFCIDHPQSKLRRSSGGNITLSRHLLTGTRQLREDAAFLLCPKGATYVKPRVAALWRLPWDR